MMSAQKLRWGILGCGNIATTAIAPAITWAQGCELLAVASRTQERATQKAAEVGAARAYGCYEALLADAEIDAVYIGLPNGEHARWAVEAAHAGKHVLCDKSLALNVADAQATRSAFRERSRLLFEGFMVRHHPQWTLAKRLVDAGTIGAVRHMRAWLRATNDDPKDHRWSKRLGGGALFDVTCYPVNVARFILGEEPARVKAAARWVKPGVDESTDALLELPSGAVASVHGSLRAPFEQGVVIAGERGRISMDRPFVPYWDPTEVVVELASGTREVHRIGGANHYLHMVEHVALCIRDREMAPFPAEDGVANVEACVAIQEACA